MMTDYHEYRRKHVFDKTGTHSKIRNSWGACDYYRAYRKEGHKKKLKNVQETIFYQMLRRVNTLLFEEFLREGELKLPYGLGILSVKRYRYAPRIKDGKLVHHTPVCWDKTFQLWFEDKEAERNHTFVYSDHPAGYALDYEKVPYSPNSLIYYEFFPTRINKTKIMDSVKRNELIYEVEH